MNITVGSYNILHPDFAIKHKEAAGLIPGTLVSNWDSRKKSILKNIRRMDADVLCLQEISLANVNKLGERLGNRGFAIAHTNHLAGDGIAVVYKANLFQEKTFSYVNENGRSSLLLTLVHHQTQTTIKIASCHLFGGPNKNTLMPHSGKAQLDKLMNAIESSPADVNIIAGDFNQDEKEYPDNSNKRKVLENKGYVFDGSLAATEIKSGRKIDWIYVKGAQKLEAVDFARHIQASDHAPALTRITLAPKAPRQSPAPVQAQQVNAPAKQAPSKAKRSLFSRIFTVIFWPFLFIARLFKRS